MTPLPFLLFRATSPHGKPTVHRRIKTNAQNRVTNGFPDQRGHRRGLGLLG